MRAYFARLTKRVRQVLRILPAARSTHQKKGSPQMERNENVKTLGEMREEAERLGVDQITRFDDPRMVELVAAMHEYASDKDWCAEFDRMAVGIGIPARPKKDYGVIERTGVFEFNGQSFEVTAKVDVYGEVDRDGKIIESAAIAAYKERFGMEFNEAVEKQWRRQALEQMVSAFAFKPKDEPTAG